MKYSIEYIEAFVAAAETGSFSAAARKLNKTQSAVSTSISNLEIDLGLQLFNRSGKLPILTEEGEMMLPNARTLLAQCRLIDEKALSLSGDTASRITLAVEEMFLPHPGFMEVLESFAQDFPHTELELLSGTLTDICHMVENRRANLGIYIHGIAPSGNYSVMVAGQLPICMVAGAAHPLVQLAAIDRAALSCHRQIVVSSREGDLLPAQAVFSSQVWKVENRMVMKTLVSQGVGWALLPRYLVEEDLAAGRLVEIGELMRHRPFALHAYLLWRGARQALRPPELWLLDTLTDVLSQL